MEDQVDVLPQGVGVAPFPKTSPGAGCTTSGVRRRGAQPGNTLALKTGLHTAPVRTFDARVRDWKKRSRLLLEFAGSVIAAQEKARRRKAPRRPRKWTSPRP